MRDPFARAVAQRAQRWFTFDSKEPIAPNSPTPAHVREAAIEAMAQQKCDHYTRRPGIAPLCQRIVQQMAAKDVSLDPNDGVVITGGAAEARYVALHALAAQSTVYLMVDQMAHYQAVADLAEITLVPFDPTNPPSRGQEGLLLIRQSPDLPSGQLAALVKWASQNNVTVIADEIDLPVLSDEALRPVASMPGMAERTLTLGGFAHEPGLQAWQVAWFAGPKPLVVKVRTLKQAMTICSPAPGQYAALAATQETNP